MDIIISFTILYFWWKPKSLGEWLAEVDHARAAAIRNLAGEKADV